MKLSTFLSFAALALAFPSCQEKRNSQNPGPKTTDTAGRIKPEDAVAQPKVDTSKNTGAGLILKSRWDEVKGKLKQQFPSLTDDDLIYTEGQEADLHSRLQTKLGKTRAEVVELLNNL